jgi:hypothetical protein
MPRISASTMSRWCSTACENIRCVNPPSVLSLRSSRLLIEIFKQLGRAAVRILAARCARAVLERFAQKRGRRRPLRKGAGKTGCPLHPQSVCNGSKHTVVTTGSPGHPAFPAQWFYSLFRALLGDRAFLPPSPPRSLLLRNLTPASGRQDHTTSPSATSVSSGAFAPDAVAAIASHTQRS